MKIHPASPQKNLGPQTTKGCGPIKVDHQLMSYCNIYFIVINNFITSIWFHCFADSNYSWKQLCHAEFGGKTSENICRQRTNSCENSTYRMTKIDNRKKRILVGTPEMSEHKEIRSRVRTAKIQNKIHFGSHFCSCVEAVNFVINSYILCKSLSFTCLVWLFLHCRSFFKFRLDCRSVKSIKRFLKTICVVNI